VYEEAMSSISTAYPNPVSSNLNIDIEDDYFGDVHLSIMSLSGEIFDYFSFPLMHKILSMSLKSLMESTKY